MEYCLGDGDGSATMWDRGPDLDLDGDGRLDAVGLDFDGDGRSTTRWPTSTATASPITPCWISTTTAPRRRYFTDDGSGTWAVAVSRRGRASATAAGCGLDGVEHTGGPLVDFDGDGQADDRLLDSDGNGLADRAI